MNKASNSEAFAKKYGPWAVVAGASEGLGQQYSLQLAERGLSIFMIARQHERLEVAAAAVRAKGVEVRTLALDLATQDVATKLAEKTGDIDIGLLVYNAGVSSQNQFFEVDADAHLQQLYVNCRGPVLLAHLFGRQMKQRQRGGIILMSSMAGFVGSGLNAVYAATKSFDTVLGEGLAKDLEGSGVDVLSMVAGATRTPQFERTQTGKSKVSVMDPVDVVAEALDSLGKTSLRIAGTNKLAAVLLTKLLPRKLASTLMTRASYSVAGLSPAGR